MIYSILLEGTNTWLLYLIAAVFNCQPIQFSALTIQKPEWKTQSRKCFKGKYFPAHKFFEERCLWQDHVIIFFKNGTWRATSAKCPDLHKLTCWSVLSSQNRGTSWEAKGDLLAQKSSLNSQIFSYVNFAVELN